MSAISREEFDLICNNVGIECNVHTRDVQRIVYTFFAALPGDAKLTRKPTQMGSVLNEAVRDWFDAAPPSLPEE